MAKSLLFDLDGTLIDSSPSILASLAAALESSSLEPVVPLTPSLIGPPLYQTLARITGCEDAEIIHRLASRFREDYDSEGYKKTVVYPGIDAVLRDLSAAGNVLFIVTNKRIVPTKLILEMLNWMGLFGSIHALDSGPLMFSSKSYLVEHILGKYAINPADAVLIGDSQNDADAARANGLRFIGVAWGYGNLRAAEDMEVIVRPEDILSLQ
jgi:phosphoglycolate phosphatase